MVSVKGGWMPSGSHGESRERERERESTREDTAGNETGTKRGGKGRIAGGEESSERGIGVGT